MGKEYPTFSKIEKSNRILEKRIESDFRFALESLKSENSSDSDISLKALDSFIKSIIYIIPEKEKELLEVADLFRKDSFDEEELIKKFSETLAVFLTSSYTVEEIEEIARRRAISTDSLLNRLVRYEISGPILSIHIPITFIDNPFELKTLFIDALEKLAYRLEHDPELADIETITATSWIVAKTRRGLTDLGFTVLDIDKRRNVGTAEISRNKLIEIYGK